MLSVINKCRVYCSIYLSSKFELCRTALQIEYEWAMKRNCNFFQSALVKCTYTTTLICTLCKEKVDQKLQYGEEEISHRELQRAVSSLLPIDKYLQKSRSKAWERPRFFQAWIKISPLSMHIFKLRSGFSLEQLLLTACRCLNSSTSKS